MRLAPFASGLVLVFAAAFGQNSPTFEVASVKPSPQPGPNERVFFGPPRGGPGSRDPGQITWSRAALRNILMTAYDVQTFQLEGPDWMANERYDIVAKVPEGATKEQVRVMWQNLLKERFGLTLHHESKEFPVDELTIGKGGPKLTPTDLAPDAEPFTPTGGPEKRDKNGTPEMNGYGTIVAIFPTANGVTASMRGKGLTLSDIAARVAADRRHPVIDKTGLSGRYDFVLDYTPDVSGLPPLPPPPDGAPVPPSPTAPLTASDPGSTMASALEKQLGLKLTPVKAKLDVIVVDHVEKSPTEN